MPISPRLALANRIAWELRAREGGNLVAVGVYGSVARGEDREYSDLDLLVVTRRKRRRVRHHFRDGVLVTVHQVTPAEARDEVLHGAWLNGPLTGWRETRPVYDPEGLIRRVKALASRPTAARFRESASRDLIETYEDLGKVRNAVAARDLAEAREMALWFSGSAFGCLVDIEGYVPRIHRRAFIDARRRGRLGRDIWRLRYEARTLDEIGPLSEAVWAGLLDRARRHGIRIGGLNDDAGAPEIRRSARAGPSRGRRGPSRSRGEA